MESVSLRLFTLLLATFVFFVFLLYRKSRKNSLLMPPGPKGWPLLGNLLHLGSMPHQTLTAMGKIYGPLFQIRMGSVPVVVASSASIVSQFLKTNDINFSSRPPGAGPEYLAYGGRDLVFAPYGPRWRALRKVCNLHLFSTKALDEFRHVREQEVTEMVQTLAETCEVKNIGKLLSICATNALSGVTIGKKVFVGDSKEDEAESFKKLVVEMMEIAGVFNIGDFVPAVAWMDLQGVVKKMKKIHKRFDDFFNKMIQERRQITSNGGSVNEDVLHAFMNLKDDAIGYGGKLTDTEIKALLLNLFSAGTDTSASTVEWALAELIRHPKLLAAAQHEIDAVVGRSRLVSESDIPNLPLLQAIIKETFRLHPSTPLSLPRIAAESCEINGFYIPKGAILLVNIYAMGRDSAEWPDTLQFHPSRFLPGGDHPNSDVKGADFELIPFGAGRRICAGMSLGIRMVQFLTATLVHSFDWVMPHGHGAEDLSMDESFGLTLQRAHPLTLTPIPRLETHLYKRIHARTGP